MGILNETYQLANGISIPRLGLGTWLMDDAEAKGAVINAVKCGYRMIDTAQAYSNETGVGEGIRACGVPREQLFVASKVAAEHKTYEAAKASIDETLEKIGLSYLDQMIIHSPQPWVEVNQSENRYEQGNLEAWRALEEARAAGKVRVIGVSNFNEHDLRTSSTTQAKSRRSTRCLPTSPTRRSGSSPIARSRASSSRPTPPSPTAWCSITRRSQRSPSTTA